MRSPRLRLVSPREKLSEYSDARKKAGEARLSMTMMRLMPWLDCLMTGVQHLYAGFFTDAAGFCEIGV